MEEVVSEKHGIQSHWCTKVSRAPFGVGPWKYIAKLWEEFNQHHKYQAGCGLHVKFWTDGLVTPLSRMIQLSTQYQATPIPYLPEQRQQHLSSNLQKTLRRLGT